METTITLDLYGNVFVNGENTNQQIGDFARNNPALAPQIDGAWRTKVVEVRAMFAAKDAEIAALKAELDALKTVAPAPIETPAEIQSDSTTE